MRLGFGLITCQRPPGERRSDAELYRDAIDVSVLAERLGLDSVWLSEHHFVDDGYMPSLLPVAAAIAARTERVTIGTALLLAPLHDPVRLAEEFEGLGISQRDRRRRLIDAIVVMRQAWSDGLVTGTSTAPYPGISVTPKPAAGGPPVWIGGSGRAVGGRGRGRGRRLLALEPSPTRGRPG